MLVYWRVKTGHYIFQFLFWITTLKQSKYDNEYAETIAI